MEYPFPVLTKDGQSRRSFLYDRKLLCGLSRCAWETLKQSLQEVLPETDGQPGAVIAVQTFGGQLEFNPHCHVLLADWGFYGELFRVAPWPEVKPVEELFRHKVFRLLLRREKIRRSTRWVPAWEDDLNQDPGFPIDWSA